MYGLVSVVIKLVISTGGSILKDKFFSIKRGLRLPGLFLSGSNVFKKYFKSKPIVYLAFISLTVVIGSTGVTWHILLWISFYLAGSVATPLES